jgi:hypothetical protein
MSPSLAHSIELLLRSPDGLVQSLQSKEEQVGAYRASLLLIVAGTACFGAVLGTSHGLLQSLYSAIKLPAAVLLTLLLTTPAFTAITAALRRPLSAANATVLVLAAAARGSLVLLALSPVLWLAMSHGLQYHRGIMTAVLCYTLADLSALRMILRGVGKDWRGRFVVLFFAAALIPAGAQSTWMLRPFMGRPSQHTLPFLRNIDGSFADSVTRSFESSVRFE